MKNPKIVVIDYILALIILAIVANIILAFVEPASTDSAPNMQELEGIQEDTL